MIAVTVAFGETVEEVAGTVDSAERDHRKGDDCPSFKAGEFTSKMLVRPVVTAGRCTGILTVGVQLELVVSLAGCHSDSF
jgi:hypothetical protein